jgi:hypothetical protein
MIREPDLPLGPPPRKAYVRRTARNVRRAYRTLFTLLILVFGGWAALDAFRWHELTHDQALLAVGFALSALLAFVIYWLVDHPLRRELRLARRGAAVHAEIVTIGKARRRRARPMVVYTFRTADGTLVQGDCPLPRRFPIETLAPGMLIDVLYDPKNPQANKPRLGLEYVDFNHPQAK